MACLAKNEHLILILSPMAIQTHLETCYVGSSSFAQLSGCCTKSSYRPWTNSIRRGRPCKRIYQTTNEGRLILLVSSPPPPSPPVAASPRILTAAHPQLVPTSLSTLSLSGRSCLPPPNHPGPPGPLSLLHYSPQVLFCL